MTAGKAQRSLGSVPGLATHGRLSSNWHECRSAPTRAMSSRVSTAVQEARASEDVQTSADVSPLKVTGSTAQIREKPASSGAGVARQDAKQTVPSNEESKAKTKAAVDAAMQQLTGKRATSTRLPPGPVVSPMARMSAATVKFLSSLPKTIFGALRSLGVFTVAAIRDPKLLKAKWDQLVKATKDMLHHYWMGSKLLWTDIKTARAIVGRILEGNSLSRRERRQLTKTGADVFRLVPFAIFVIVPFMELLLPVALKLWPNMLPSTFQDSLKKEEDMKRELKLRLALAGFLQDTLQEMARHKKDVASSTEQRATAEELVEFIDRAKHGEMVRTEDVTRLARFFKDELTLDNIPRPQLVTLCRYMGLRPFGADGFLRFQLRSKLNGLKEDDRRILWEGLDSLNKLELQEACRERGMRATGLTTEGYRKQLQQWLDLSINKSVPISLLIMSRAFTLEAREFQPEEVLRDSISSMDDDVINEVVLDAASREEADTPELRRRRLESIEFQNEMIEDERDDAEQAKKAAEEKAKALDADKQAQLRDAMRVAEEIRRLEQMMARAPPGVETEPAIDAADMAFRDMAAGDRRVDPTAVRMLAHSLHASKPKPATSGTPAASSPAKHETDEAPSSSSSPKPAIKSLAVVPVPENTTKPLSLAEMQAISELAQPSSVEAERIQLAMMKAMMRTQQEEVEYQDISLTDAPQADELSDEQKQLEADLALADISEELRQEVLELESMVAEREKLTEQQEKLRQQATKPEAEEEDPNVARMRKMLVSMLDKLESRIEKAESAIGDKLRLLDKDQDGVLDAQELREVVHHALKRHATEEEAQEIVSMLDKDSDGKVSVQEIMDWVEVTKAKVEIQAFEERLRERRAKIKQRAQKAVEAKAAAAAAAEGSPDKSKPTNNSSDDSSSSSY